MSKLLDLPFDQYQRYQLVSQLLEELREGGEQLAILDVGGRTALLRGFLRKDRITLVDLEPSGERGLVLGDGSALPFADASFDVVCAFDTLEHVPPALRERFVAECARVARRYVVLAGPYQSEEVEEAEKLLQSFLREKLGVQHRYLEEHRHNGLPDRETVERQFVSLGARVASLGHGNVQRWLSLISLAMYMDHTPALQSQAARLHRFYNRGLFEDDRDPPVYRHALIAAFHGARLPKPLSEPRRPRAPSRELVHFAQELAAFDAHRDGYEKEFARLQSVVHGFEADLAGHKQTLAEALELRTQAQQALREVSADLEGHKATLKELRAHASESDRVISSLRADLEGHRRSLAEASGQRNEAEQVIRTLEGDLAGHRRSLEELRALRAQSEATVAELQRDLAGHRGSLDEIGRSVSRYEELLAEHRAVVRDREGELERHGRVLEDLRANLARLDAQRGKQLDLREPDLREPDLREFEAVRLELRREIDELQRTRGELQAELASRGSHTAALEQLLAGQQAAFEREQQALVEQTEAAAREWEAERRQFEQIVAAREGEIERHAAVLAELRERLEVVDRERARLLELRTRERDEAEQTVAALRDELERSQVAGAQALAVQRESYEAHMRSERGAFETVVAERESELARHVQAQADLRRDLEEHRKVVTDLGADLEGHRRVVAELREETRTRSAELSSTAHELAVRDAELAAARAQNEELQAANERAAAALRAQDRLVGELRAELRNRVSSLRRALGPRRRTPGE
ncbi:MAG: methyltransferase domain-containing protein [Planctomycetes bacterium]|nr:methyltransferase domain-containing protein [Planctomycetota bacterium]